MKSSYRVKRVSLFVAAAMLLSFAGAAEAGDCKNVRFHFINGLSSKIKVRGVEIKGNQGTWTEAILNHEISTSGDYTSDGRDLQKLDSGKAPDYMTVNYDKWDAPNDRWLSRSKKYENRQVCDDNDTYNFNIQ